MWHTIISRERRHALSKLSRNWRTLLNLRLLSLTLSLLGFISFTTAIPTWQSLLIHTTGPFKGDWTDIIPLIPLLFIILTDVFIITSTIRKCHAPAPMHISILEAILIVLLTPALALAILGSVFLHFAAAVPDTQGVIRCASLQNYLSRECSPNLYTIGSLQLLGVVFGCVLWVLHVALAIWVALDVRRYRQRTATESNLERRRRRWREERGHTTKAHTRTRSRRHREADERTGTGAYESYGWYR